MDLAALGAEDLLVPGTISSSADPELATRASEEALAAAYEKPQMKDAPPGLVTLPGGWIDSRGVLQTTAMVKELTGRDEERLSRIDAQTNLPTFLQTMVSCGTETIGGQPAEKDMLNDLLVGDREALILGIRFATYGEDLPMEVRCPHCAYTEKISLELRKDIPVKQMETPEIRQYDVPLRNGRLAVITPATCGLQDQIWDPKKNVGQLKTETLVHCVVSIDGRPTSRPDILDMGMADRNTLLDRLAELQPGPDYREVRLDCQGCGREFPLDLTLTDLFRS